MGVVRDRPSAPFFFVLEQKRYYVVLFCFATKRCEAAQYLLPQALLVTRNHGVIHNHVSNRKYMYVDFVFFFLMANQVCARALQRKYAVMNIDTYMIESYISLRSGESLLGSQTCQDSGHVLPLCPISTLFRACMSLVNLHTSRIVFHRIELLPKWQRSKFQSCLCCSSSEQTVVLVVTSVACAQNASHFTADVSFHVVVQSDLCLVAFSTKHHIIFIVFRLLNYCIYSI